VDESASALASAPLLSRLPADARARLEADALPLELAAGDFLFHEGDAANDLYVVQEGRLEVIVAGSVVRQLGAGAVIGELALLTGGTRSASIRARRDSHVLRVSHDAFTDSVGQDPAALTALAQVLAEQLQSGGSAAPAGAAIPQPRLVAVVAMHRGAPAAAVADVLADELAQTLRVGTPGQVGPDGLERAERDHDRVVLVADDPEGDADWWAMCLRQADHLVLVADAAGPVPDAAPLGRNEADLVLVGARSSEQVRAWEAAISPWKITLTDGVALAADLRPVGVRIAGRSVGVVMAGGGARAFAHLGVLHELTEAGVIVDRVAGASVGSIVASLWASGRTPQEVEDIVYAEMVRGRPFSDYTLPIASIAKGKRVEKGLRRYFGDLTIEELPRRLVCMSTDLQSRQPFALRRGPVVEAVMASVALPGLFAPRRAGQRLLADGGILDNLPVGALTDRDEGPVLAVNIGMGGGSPRQSDGPGAAAAVVRPVRIPALGETLMRTIFIGSGGATETARAAGAIVVTPSTMGVGLLEFHQIDRMIESGRAAARAVLDEPGNGLV
jgi:predicted acylesterase/phospholipase RssA/CRP-like cAMP-binding protein